MDNHSILERNIIHSLGAYSDSDGAVNTFLTLVEKVGTYEAEKIANEWGSVSDFLTKMSVVSRDLTGFIQERHLNMHSPNTKLRRGG